MIALTQNASRALDDFFLHRPKTPLRIHISPDNRTGAGLVLALDEAGANDDTFESNGFEFIVEKELDKIGQPFTIDASERGFHIDSSLTFSEGCGCGSNCGCGADRAADAKSDDEAVRASACGCDANALSACDCC